MEPLIPSNTSLTRGRGYESLTVISFTGLMSPQKRHPGVTFFGTITTGDTHELFECSITPAALISTTHCSAIACLFNGMQRGSRRIGCAVPVSISCWIKWVLPRSEGEVARMDRNSYSKSHTCCCCSVDNPSLQLSSTVLIVSSWVGGLCEIPHVMLPSPAALLAASSPVRHS